MGISIDKIRSFFNNRNGQSIILGRPAKGKSKSIIYLMFEPLFKNGSITKDEFDKIITSDKSNSETYLEQLFGNSRANEIETAMKLKHLKSK